VLLATICLNARALRCLEPCRPSSGHLLFSEREVAFYMRSPEELGEAEIRRFLLHQIQVEDLSHSSYRQILAALKFLYTVTLHPRLGQRRPYCS